jgi:iron complex outermembrane receptor protein
MILTEVVYLRPIAHARVRPCANQKQTCAGLEMGSEMIIQRNARRRLPALATLLGSTILGHATFAAEASTPQPFGPRLEEVIVTARKQSENVQEIPESITAIDSRTITEEHLVTLDDFNSLVTNINIVQRADNTPDVVIRGVGTFGVVQGVGFYVNDVQQFDGQSVRPDDIDRIEVLKGPQGTLFGGSNVGGAIKYVTKLPSETPTAEATFEYGAFNERTEDGVVSGPIIPGRLLARLSAFNDQSDGYLFDSIFNRNLPGSEEAGGRLTLEYLQGRTKAVFYYSMDYIDSENMNLYYTPPNDHTYQPIYNGGVNGTVPHFRRYLYSPTLEITHDFGDVLLTSISSYFHSAITSTGNLDKGAFYALFGLPIAIDYPQDFGKSVWSQELRLSSNGGSPFNWLVGAFIQEIGSTGTQIQNVYQVATIGSPVGETLLQSVDTVYNHKNQDFAIFGNASYDLARWTFEGGLRVGYFNNTMTDTSGNCLPCYGRVSATDVLPKGSIDYHFSKDVMGYFTVARGDEEGDLTDNPNDVNVNEVLPFKTEFALSYEVGVKSSLFDHRLTLNVAGFYIDYTNRIFEVGKIGSSGGIFTYNANVGSSHNYGFEVEFAARPTSELSFTGGVGVTKAEFGPAAILDGYGNPLNTNGHPGPDTPEYQATLAADWRHRLSDKLVLNARVDSRFVGLSYWSAAGCNALSPGCPYQGYDAVQRPYQIVGAGVSLDIGRHFSVGAHVSNLFDVRYNTLYSDLSESGAPYNIAGINGPRRWVVSVTARY